MAQITLEISCADAIAIKDRMTFDSCLFKGVQVTYWPGEKEDNAHILGILDAVFDIVCEEELRRRKGKRAVEAADISRSIIKN